MSSSSSGTKRRSTSPPSTPPHRVKRQLIMETEKATAETMEDKKERYGKYVHGYDDTPEPSERAKNRLLSLQEPPRIDDHLLSLVNSLLNGHHNHAQIPHIPDLSQLISLVFDKEDWKVFADKVFKAIQADSPLRQEMALKVIVNLSETTDKFWYTYYDSLLWRFLDLFESQLPNIQAMTHDASVKLIPFLFMGRYDQGIDLLLQKIIAWIQRTIRTSVGRSIVETRIMELVELAKSCTSSFLNRIGLVFNCMLIIVQAADYATSTFLKCQAIRIMKILDDEDLNKASTIYNAIPNDNRRRIMENCVRLMFVIEDYIAWYNMDNESNEFIGASQAHSMGLFLLVHLCLHSEEAFLISFAFDVIPRYLNSEDWRIRQAAVIAFGAIGLSCDDPCVIREIAEKVLDISLNDHHPRVLCAAFEAMENLTKFAAKEHIIYLNRFFPTIVTIFTSNSNLKRLQFQAASIVRQLYRNCDQEFAESLLADMAPELCTFLELNEDCQALAFELLNPSFESDQVQT